MDGIDDIDDVADTDDARGSTAPPATGGRASSGRPARPSSGGRASELPPVDLGSVASALPGLARVAAASALRMASWGLETANATTTRAFKAIAAGEPVGRVVAEIAEELVGSQAVVGRPTRPARPGPSGRSGRSGRPGGGTTGSGANGSSPGRSGRRRGATAEELRAKGAALLAASADVWRVDDTHPAYERILDQLSPDEARILRFLCTDGPQPSIDIRTNRPLGVGSELVASGLSMIGLHAGVRHLERTKADLNNLERLGLIWFSKEPVADPSRYQVVEVQPDVLEELKKAGRSPKIIHRSVHLTPFGEDFCRVCFPPPH